MTITQQDTEALAHAAAALSEPPMAALMLAAEQAWPTGGPR